MIRLTLTDINCNKYITSASQATLKKDLSLIRSGHSGLYLSPKGHKTVRALSDECFLASGGQAAFAMSHERFGR